MKSGHEHGQATVLTLVMLTVLLGMAALVLDVGSWYRADRQTQSAADAAALAGAQALPYDAANADNLANEYIAKNGGGDASVNLSNSFGPNDTISVNLKRTSPGVFTRILGLSSVNVGSKATARVANPTQARFVAPIVVNKLHPDLNGKASCPCFGSANETTLPLGKTGAPGAFGLLNLDQSHGGTSPGTLADWMLKGYDGYLPLGGYFSDPGAKFNSSQVQNALQQRIGTVLLFPVYDTLTGNGANASYHVIGWVGFHLDGFSARGSSGSLTGYFTEVIWDGLQNQSGSSNEPDFGARSVQLID
jgi:hypothetical protein